MINERNLAEKFHSIWKMNFPLLNSNYMRLFNEEQVYDIEQPVIDTLDNVRYDLVSECAFNIVSNSYDKTSIDNIINEDDELAKIVKATAKSIWLSGNFTENELKLSLLEVEQVRKISKNLEAFIRRDNPIKVVFRPELRGYGFIPDLEADLSIDDTLYEIKTVKRNFKTSDLKQLIIYLALQQVNSESKSWEYAGLYNPRKGKYCRFKVSTFISNITGGKTPNEAFYDFLNSLIRDIQTDSKF